MKKYIAILMIYLILLPIKSQAYTLGINAGGVKSKNEMTQESKFGPILGLELYFKLWDYLAFQNGRSSSNTYNNSGTTHLFYDGHHSHRVGQRKNITSIEALAYFTLFIVVTMFILGIFYVLGSVFSYQLEFGTNLNFGSLDGNNRFENQNSYGMGLRMFLSRSVPVYLSGFLEFVTSNAHFGNNILKINGYRKRAALGLMSYSRKGPYVEFSWGYQKYDQNLNNIVHIGSIKNQIPIGSERYRAVVGYTFKF